MHERHEHADKAPGEHDARNPFRCREPRCDERARNLEEQVAREEDAGTRAVDFRREPAEVSLHRQRRIRNVDTVKAGDDRDEEDRKDDPEIPLALENLHVHLLFHDDSSYGI